jgi:hypothetical protein
MTRDQWRYVAQLTRALRVENVDGTHIGEFVTEVASHLDETGADPVTEFGRPW